MFAFHSIVICSHSFLIAAILIQMLLQLSIIFICALSVPFCTGQSVQTYFVTPDASTKCPGDPCYNLTTYIQNSEEYLQSYSTFVFLPGVHHLDSESPALFQDLVDIQLRASDDFGFVPRTVSTFVRQYALILMQAMTA